MIGCVCNLFTSVWLSRSMFDYVVGRKQQATLSI
jgi:preprotein translocase subunit SecD